MGEAEGEHWRRCFPDLMRLKMSYEEGAKPEPIINRMEDCGDGRHVGWWSVDLRYKQSHLLVEIEPGVMVIACCEGENAERRIHFIVKRDQAVEIVRAMAKALGIDATAASPCQDRGAG